MESVRTFFESSTIHGLSYISTTNRKVVRLFWLPVVIGGFTGAGYIIYESFDDWAEAPITTTIETLPIEDIIFPTVTVCPPRKTFTTLNYDLIRMENMTLDNDTRNELINFTETVISHHSLHKTKKDLKLLKDPDRFYNWLVYSDSNTSFG